MFNLENSIYWFDNFSTDTGDWKIQNSWVIIGNFSCIIPVNKENAQNFHHGIPFFNAL